MQMIPFVVPAFFFLLLMELFYNYRKKANYYRLNDSINDMSLGLMQVVASLFLNVILIAFYNYIYLHFSIQSLFNVPEIPEQSILWYVLSIFIVDHQYYWFHRHCHEVNILWATHEVHHQSEEYNLTVALRQGLFQVSVTFLYFIPVALMGIPTEMFLFAYIFGIFYQYWIHTRIIKKMPAWFEWLLNTPSHHRVHHGRNPKYIDRNHAGVFMLWDRMYGTFKEEEEEPVYGITQPINNWNPIKQNFNYFSFLLKNAIATNNFWDKIKIWFMPPGWRPPDVGPMLKPKEVDMKTYRKYDPPLQSLAGIYVLLQLGILGIAFPFLSIYSVQVSLIKITGIAAVYIWTMINMGELMESNRKAIISDLLRNITVPVLLAIQFHQNEYFLPILLSGIVVALTNLIFLSRIKFEATETVAERAVNP